MERLVVKRFRTGRSAIARLSRAAGTLALPVLIVSLISHKLGAIDPLSMAAGLAAGGVLGLSAIAGAFYAYGSVWWSGKKGAGNATIGLFLGALAIAPAGAVAYGVMKFPEINDVSTDGIDPPALVGRDGANKSQIKFDLQRQAYPDIRSRRFRMEPAELHNAAAKVAEDSGWRVVSELPPEMLDAPTRLQMEAATAVLGFTDDVTVRIRPDRFGAILDIRSASRLGVHDLGANARRIRTFFVDLDAVLQESYGDLAKLTVDEEDILNSPELLEDELFDLPLIEDDKPEGPEAIPVPRFKPYVLGAVQTDAGDGN